MGSLDDVTIPVGGSFWRALGASGTLIVGYLIVLVHCGLLVVDAIISPGLDWQSADRLGSVMLWSTMFGPLFAMCFLIIGELQRRGDWGGPSRHKPDAALPQGTNTVELRMLPLVWHFVWGVLALGAAVVLLRGLAADPWTERFTVWVVNGIFAVGIAGAVLASGVKKWSWARTGHARARQPATIHPALVRRGVGRSRSRTFWRWVSFRWRLDLWACGFGMIAVWLGALMLTTQHAFTGSADSTTLVARIVIPGGGALAILALWASTQFWRAGEDLAGHESVA